MKKAGFEIITQRDHNGFGRTRGGKRWWYMFEENSRALEAILSLIAKIVFTETWIRMAEKLFLVPLGTADTHDLMHSLGAGM